MPAEEENGFPLVSISLKTRARHFIAKIARSALSLALPKFGQNLRRRTNRKLQQKPQDRENLRRAAREVNKARARLQIGLGERALTELRAFAEDGSRPHRSGLAAWELAVWHLNQGSEEDARAALRYLALATADVDVELFRKTRILEAEARHRLGELELARQLLSEALAQEEHPDVLFGLANLEGCAEAKIEYINRAFYNAGLQQVRLRREPDVPPYQRLSSVLAPQNTMSEDVRLASVIMPAHNLGEGIRVAIDSMLEQSWQNIELLVVDDSSTDSTANIVGEYCSRDSRVHLIRTEENAGPYVARNLALKEAAGEFVTCNDADDWSHPEKIETQVRHLLDNPEIVANTSNQARVYEDLTFYRRGNAGFYTQINLSSLMFRRAEVVSKIGYWDSVRFGGDSEYLRRIKRVFGEMAVASLEASLSFQLQRNASLTASSAFGYHGFKMGARRHYDEIAKRFHDTAKSVYVDFPLRRRPFPLPEPMLPERKVASRTRRHFELVLVSDFRLPGGTSSSNAEEIKAQKRSGLRSGLVQMNIYDIGQGPTNPKILDLIDGDQVEMLVYGEDISCDLLIIRHPWVLQDWNEYVPNIDAKSIRVIINQPPCRIYGPNPERTYHIGQCAANLKRYFGDVTSMWHPIGPLVREALVTHHAEELGTIRLGESNWENIIDVDEWRRSVRPPREPQVRIGRHARDESSKWPSLRQDLLLAYPDSDKYAVKIMGGARAAERVLGGIPNNWAVLKFGALHPKEFLADLDVFVYFTHEHWVESFGRTILEAMAVGVPVILPVHYKELFEEAAIYAQPHQVLEVVDKLMADDNLYDRQVRIAQDFVQRRFGPDMHTRRVNEILLNVR